MSAPRHARTHDDRTVPSLAYLVGGVLLTVVGVAALVVLHDDADARSALLTFLIPLITALLVSAKVEHATGQQNAALDDIRGTVRTVEHQTNGVLSERIRTELRAELDAREQRAPEPS